MKNKINQFLEENLIIILCAGLILVIIISLPLLVGRREEGKAQTLPAQGEQLALSPSPVLLPPPLSFSLHENYSLKSNTSFSLEVVPQKEISALIYRLEILFDPQVLEAEEVLAGSFFKYPQILKNKIDNQEGRIDFSISISPEEKIASGEPKSKAPLLTIIFRVKSLAAEEELFSTTISFGEKTILINEEKEFSNLNRELEPIVITAGNTPK